MEDIAQAVRTLAADATAETVRVALEDGAQPVDIIDRGIVRGMEAVGEAYQREEVFLPELLMAEQCMRRGLAEIEDYAGEDGVPVVEAAQQRLAEQAASWIPALSSCVTRLLHSSDSFLKS
jgi:5-methyltetrahydrofolate--homocysteine methyltransferase